MVASSDHVSPEFRDDSEPIEYRLLIADDDRGFRETLQILFEPFFALLEAESGEEALEIVEAEPIHLVLIDMHMHELTGLETVRLIHSMNISAPSILITADATEELRQEAIAENIFDVLKKPVGKRDLFSTVSGAMERTYARPFPLN